MSYAINKTVIPQSSDNSEDSMDDHQSLSSSVSSSCSSMAPDKACIATLAKDTEIWFLSGYNPDQTEDIVQLVREGTRVEVRKFGKISAAIKHCGAGLSIGMKQAQIRVRQKNLVTKDWIPMDSLVKDELELITRQNTEQVALLDTEPPARGAAKRSRDQAIPPQTSGRKIVTWKSHNVK